MHLLYIILVIMFNQELGYFLNEVVSLWDTVKNGGALGASFSMNFSTRRELCFVADKKYISITFI